MEAKNIIGNEFEEDWEKKPKANQDNSMALWSRTESRDSTGPLARPFDYSLAPLTYLLARSLMGNFFAVVFFSVLDYSAP